MDTWGGDATVHMSREGGCNPIHDLFCITVKYAWPLSFHTLPGVTMLTQVQSEYISRDRVIPTWLGLIILWGPNEEYI